MTHISADVQRITLNASSCITISGGRTEQLDIIILQVFCRVTGFTSDFSPFHSCGTYSVLSWSPSIAAFISRRPIQRIVLIENSICG